MYTGSPVRLSYFQTIAVAKFPLNITSKLLLTSPGKSAGPPIALRYCWAASLLLGDDVGTAPVAAGCPADEQAATRTQLLAAIAMAVAHIRPIAHMIGASELTLRLRGQFVAQPPHRRDGISDCRESVSSLPPRPDSGCTPSARRRQGQDRGSKHP